MHTRARPHLPPAATVLTVAPARLWFHGSARAYEIATSKADFAALVRLFGISAGRYMYSDPATHDGPKYKYGFLVVPNGIADVTRHRDIKTHDKLCYNAGKLYCVPYCHHDNINYKNMRLLKLFNCRDVIVSTWRVQKTEAHARKCTMSVNFRINESKAEHIKHVRDGDSADGFVTINGVEYKYQIYMFEITTVMKGKIPIFDNLTRDLILTAWLVEFDRPAQ